MKIIKFSRAFAFTALLSAVLVVAGIAGYLAKGFNLGIDFQAGVIEEIVFAPRAFSLRYDGAGNAAISVNASALTIAVSGVGVQGFTYQYLLGDYRTVGDFAQALDQVEGISAEVLAPSATPFKRLFLDTQISPVLGADPYWVHFVPVNAAEVPLEEVRGALAPLGEAAVQIAGDSGDRSFLIRMQETDMPKDANGGFVTESISRALKDRFGEGEIAVTSSNFVGSRFSKNLADQAIILLMATLLLILVYASIRFKPQFAIGAVLAIMHDAVIIVAFVVWTGMEFNTTTIAAILTILGYSINDTIVIFDRVREDRLAYPEEVFDTIMNRSITETLSRTFITTFTTMLAVASLYIFTSGSMKDFALALLVGMVSGVYSTIYIACGFVAFWEKYLKRETRPSGVKV
ncbi:MAG: protein translocase subunit SecF [Treponema sp.]|jgi:preprotein translocase subunit SecF|nr:protein translocase subunit SecF [Treponema sp.]